MRLRATLKLRNEEMLAARERLGLTQMALAAVARVPRTAVAAFERLDFSYESRRDSLARQAQRISDALEITVELVFPPELRGQKLRADRTEVAIVPPGRLLQMVEEREAHLLACAQDEETQLAAKTELATLLDDPGSPLTDREHEMVVSHYGIGREPETFAAIARRFGCSLERARQLVTRALPKLEQRARFIRAGTHRDERLS